MGEKKLREAYNSWAHGFACMGRQDGPTQITGQISEYALVELFKAFAAPDEDELKPDDEVTIEGVEPPWGSGRFRFDAEDGPSHKTVQVSVLDGRNHVYLHVDPRLLRKVKP